MEHPELLEGHPASARLTLVQLDKMFTSEQENSCFLTLRLLPTTVFSMFIGSSATRFLMMLRCAGCSGSLGRRNRLIQLPVCRNLSLKRDDEAGADLSAREVPPRPLGWKGWPLLLLLRSGGKLSFQGSARPLSLVLHVGSNLVRKLRLQKHHNKRYRR